MTTREVVVSGTVQTQGDDLTECRSPLSTLSNAGD